MAFMPFTVNRVGPYGTMKIMKSMKEKMNPGNGRGLPYYVQAPLQEPPIGHPSCPLCVLW